LSLPAAAGEPANEASPKVAVPWRGSPRRVQEARKRVPPRHDRNTGLKSVRPAVWSLAAVNISVLHLQHPNVNWVLHSAHRATNSSAPSAGHAAAGYNSAECATRRVLCQRYSGLQTRWAHRLKARVPNL